eukprot:547367-Rhodomonas_salina.1
MESIFTEEAISKHPLKQLLIWKRMSSRFHQISQKDHCACMTAVQMHASHIGRTSSLSGEGALTTQKFLTVSLIPVLT